ncbi:protein singed [Pseudomonas sp. R1-18]|uniref:protein singed n=1 Tax=Pseudomonas sp. R1-18 TaxID=1632772 RepID=UPI003DA7ABDD
MQYVTIAAVDAALGETWAAQNEKARYVAMANAWLNSQTLRPVEPDAIPQGLIDAGVELAAAAAAGELYQTKTEGEVLSKSVKAGSVSSAKTFASVSGTSAALPARVQFALALIEPWKASAFSFAVHRG